MSFNFILRMLMTLTLPPPMYTEVARTHSFFPLTVAQSSVNIFFFGSTVGLEICSKVMMSFLVFQNSFILIFFNFSCN